MPELPEVETICRGLSQKLQGQKIEKASVHCRNLRTPVPRGFVKKVLGLEINHIRRRAKYILIETSGSTILNHLGMTGKWRPVEEDQLVKHDHVVLQMSSGLKLAYNDSRRFGFFDLLRPGQELHSSWLAHLGPEPLDPVEFSAEYACERASRSVKAPVKSLIMNQEFVVGVGNIYASEALFRAGIRPLKKARSLSLLDWKALTGSIREVLCEAIDQGGTTLRDYRQADGLDGRFQQRLFVYGRQGESCLRCQKSIQKKVLSGRSTYWCRGCQS